MLELQKKIYNLNCHKNINNLKFSKKLLKYKNENLLLLQHWFDEELVNKNFKHSMSILHPNLINYLINNKICDIYNCNEKKSYYYLESIKNKNKVFISGQIWFGYILMKQLEKMSDKKILKELFNEDGIIGLEIEKSTKYSNLKTRIDFLLSINNRKIVFEFLEEYHKKEEKTNSDYQANKVSIMYMGSLKDEIIHVAFFWYDKISNKYINKRFNNIYKIIKDYYLIDNEEKYIIKQINKYINNKKLSKLLFNAYKNENKPILDITKINELFMINKNIFNRFLRRIELIKTKINSNDFFDSDSDDSDDEIEIDDDIYYIEKNKKIFLTNNGLSLYLHILKPDDFIEPEKYKYIIKFNNLLGKSVYKSAIKIRELILKQKENLHSGYEK